MPSSSHPTGKKDDIVRRYEQMLRNKEWLYFALEDFEHVIGFYQSTFQWEQALQACQLALEQYPYSYEVRVEKAGILLKSGKPAEALAFLEQAEAYNPLDENLLLTKASALSELKAYRQALDCYEQALPLASEKDQVHHRMAGLYVLLDKPVRAVRHLSDALRLNPENDELVLDLVDALGRIDKVPEGAKFLASLIDEQPHVPALWRNLGLYHNETAQFDQAIAALQEATRLKNDYFSGWMSLGHAYMNKGEYDRASLAYQQVVEQGEADAEVYCHLAASQEKAGQLDLAMRHYRAALALDEQYDDAWYGLGACLMAAEKWYESLSFLKKATKINPYKEEYWIALAEAEYEVGNVVSCLEAYEKASELAPANADIWLDWSFVLYEQGDFDQALGLVESGLDDNPTNAFLHYRACAYLIAAGKYKQGLSYLENALILDFEKHTVLYEFFTSVDIQKALFKIINQYKQ